MSKSLLLCAALCTSFAGALASVPSGYSVSPAPGSTVEEIRVISVTNSLGYLDPYVVNRVIKVDGVGYKFTTKKEGNMDQTLVFTLETAVTSAGTHEVIIPASTFTIGWDEDDNQEISFNLIIEETEEPDPGPGPDPIEFTPIDNPGFTISPAQGEVAQIKDFTIEYDRSGLFPEGNSYMKPTLVNEATSETVATFNVEEGGGLHDVVLSLSEAYTVPGTYLVSFEEGAIYDAYDNDWPAASFRYVIAEGVDPVVPQEPVSATPENESVVDYVDNILLYFPGITEVYASGINKDSVSVKKDGQPVETVASWNFDSTTMEDGEIELVFTPALTESGAYEIYVPARALSLAISTFDTRWNDEFTLRYDVEGVLAAGTKITVEPLDYLVISGIDRTLAVTWTSNESKYNSVTAVPSTVEYDGETWTVTEIGKYAFSDVPGLGNVTIPETVTAIRNGAFWDSNLQGITLPESILIIEDDAFNNTKLKSITIPSSVVEFGDDICYANIQLEEIVFPNNLQAVPNGFAQGCSVLEEVNLPASVKSIGQFAFSECAGLTSIDLPEGLTKLDKFAFAYTTSLTDCPVPTTLQEVGTGVFYQSGLTSASLPEAITVIPNGMYQCCASLPEFRVNDNVTEIEKEAFYWCFALSKIYLGSALTTIGEKVFWGDNALTEVTCAAEVPPTGAEFEDGVYASATLYVPAASVEAYKGADGWKQFVNIQPMGQSAVQYVAAEESEVSIYDAAGRLVFEGNAADARLTKGIYILKNASKTVKVIR